MECLESWTDFRRGEIVAEKRKRKIKCQICEKKLSNPGNDGKATWNDTGKPVYTCDDCQDAEDNKYAQEDIE